MKITLSKGGTNERKVELSSIRIPDLWHIAQRLDAEDKELVLKCWHLARDLKNALEDSKPKNRR